MSSSLRSSVLPVRATRRWIRSPGCPTDAVCSPSATSSPPTTRTWQRQRRAGHGETAARRSRRGTHRSPSRRRRRWSLTWRRVVVVRSLSSSPTPAARRRLSAVPAACVDRRDRRASGSRRPARPAAGYPHLCVDSRRRCRLPLRARRRILRTVLLLLLHPFNGLFSRTTWVRRYQKGKISLVLNEVRNDGVLRCSGINWTICKQSAPHSRLITTPTPRHSIFYRPDALPDAQPAASKH